MNTAAEATGGANTAAQPNSPPAAAGSSSSSGGGGAGIPARQLSGSPTLETPGHKAPDARTPDVLQAAEAELAELRTLPAYQQLSSPQRGIVKRIASILNTKSDSIVLTNPLQPDGPIVYVTQAWQQMCGYCMRDAVGQNPRLTQGKASDSASLQAMSVALKQQRACKVRLVNYRGGSNDMFWNCLSVHPIFHAGKLVLFAARLQDYTYQMSRFVMHQPIQFCKMGDQYQQAAHLGRIDVSAFSRPCALRTGRKLRECPESGDLVIDADDDDDDESATTVAQPEQYVKRLAFSGIPLEPEYLLDRLRDECGKLNLTCRACEVVSGGAELMRLEICVASDQRGEANDLRALVHVMPEETAGHHCITLTRLQGNTFQFHSVYRTLRMQLADLLIPSQPRAS